MIIGLGHYSRTGKDTAANVIKATLESLRPDWKIEKLSLAYKLKMQCYELYHHLGIQHPAYYDTPEGMPRRNVVIPALGMTPVELWVKYGTPCVREQIYENTWVDLVVQASHQVDVLIVPDVRFPNEVEAIIDDGGVLIKCVRDGFGPKDTVADKALLGYDDWDLVFGPNLRSLLEQSYRLAEMVASGEEQSVGASQTDAERQEILRHERL